MVFKPVLSQADRQTDKIFSYSVLWTGGNRGNRFTGPGAPEGSRGAWEDQITRVQRGPGKAKSQLCFRIDKKWGLVLPPGLIGHPKVSRLPEVPGPQGFLGPRTHEVSGRP
jgi:hypothetical protein